MLNRSKITDPRMWDRWHAAGSVEGMDAAYARAVARAIDPNFQPMNRPRFKAETEIKMYGDIALSSGFRLDAAEVADLLKADDPVPMIGRPSEVAAAIAADVNTRILDNLEITHVSLIDEDKLINPATVVHVVKAASVTVPDAASALGVHPTTIRRRLARGTYKGDQDANGVWTITDPEIVAAVQATL
jgi:hypothetical protein